MNFFNYPSAAKRYAAGRPYFHPIVRDAILAHLEGTPHPMVALDIACGTGLSTRILADFVPQVIGVDQSEGMLAEAFKSNHIEYRLGEAEHLPIPDASVDLATVALAFHWFERKEFLLEAKRALRMNAYLVIYNHWFSGTMTSQSEFKKWHEVYLTRYPSPKRDQRPFGPEDARAAGFVLEKREEFTNYWPFSGEELALYLITQSNVIAAVESGAETAGGVYDWIVETTRPLFGQEHETFLFGGNIIFLRKNEER